MVRTQVQLTETQLQALRELSGSTGKSISDLVRQGVDLYLRSQTRISREEQIRRALGAAGCFASGRTDIGEEHDRYLAESFGS
jgi:Arc/MetJ-type ribon-helix-helix transcriptional regulator